MSDWIESKLDEDTIVIRIPKEYIRKVAIHVAFEGITGYEDIKVVDFAQLMQDIRMELNREAEDGTTLMHIMLDDAIRNAFDNGSEAFEENS